LEQIRFRAIGDMTTDNRKKSGDGGDFNKARKIAVEVN
jgi:hypothetical protein